MYFMRIMLLVCAVAGLAACSPALDASGNNAPRQAPIDQTVVAFSAQEAMARINAVRARHRLAPLRIDTRLTNAAETHAELMGRTGKFGHEFGPATQFKRRIFAAGFQNSAGENLGVGYRSIEEAIEGWLNSPGHRKILLKPTYSLGGIAYHANVSGKSPRLNHFWVLIMGANS